MEVKKISEGIETDNPYAVYVGSSREFRIGEDLAKKGITTFFSKIRMVLRWTDQKKFVDFPLFSYVFTNIEKNTAERKTMPPYLHGPRRTGAHRGRADRVSEKAVENDVLLDSYPNLKESGRVRIKSGSLAGIEGLSVKIEGKSLLVLSVILQKGSPLR